MEDRTNDRKTKCDKMEKEIANKKYVKVVVSPINLLGIHWTFIWNINCLCNLQKNWLLENWDIYN